LLGLLVRAFAHTEPVIIGMDETLERRQGHKIAAKGLYRDAARSSRSMFVKSHGLRGISMMLLAPIPWAGRVCLRPRSVAVALPFLSVLWLPANVTTKNTIVGTRLWHAGRAV
jgi:hypothetical protein